jgi:hypothetical protein
VAVAVARVGAGFHQHYGRENVVRNNIFALGEEFQLMRTRAEAHVSFTFEGNIVYYNSGALLGSNWTGDQFHMHRNVYWDVRGGSILFAGRTFDEWRKQGQDTASVVADPIFANADNFDSQLLTRWQARSKAILKLFRCPQAPGLCLGDDAIL